MLTQLPVDRTRHSLSCGCRRSPSGPSKFSNFFVSPAGITQGSPTDYPLGCAALYESSPPEPCQQLRKSPDFLGRYHPRQPHGLSPGLCRPQKQAVHRNLPELEMRCFPGSQACQGEAVSPQARVAEYVPEGSTRLGGVCPNPGPGTHVGRAGCSLPYPLGIEPDLRRWNLVRQVACPRPDGCWAGSLWFGRGTPSHVDAGAPS